MPLWAWVLLVLAALLAVMAVWDWRVRARGGRLNDPGTITRGVIRAEAGAEANPEAHRGVFGGPPF